MRRSSAATSDGQMDHGQVRKPRTSRQKPVTWPDMAFGHLTGYAFVGRVGQNLAMALVRWRADWVRCVIPSGANIERPLLERGVRPARRPISSLGRSEERRVGKEC